ncbi:MAG: GHKL domain-containing protein [Planctomycetes bacterium]|nr:GHKL domain-containing protein [Planctomycetota bacterium]
MEPVAETTALVKRAYWLVRLRWIAAVSVGAGTCFASNVFAITLPDLAMYGIAILLAVYNAAVLLLLNCLVAGKCKIRGLSVKAAIHFQISADLLILTLLLHFSGGIENPLYFYFVFHMIIASILLSVRASYLQATFAVLLFGLLILLEYLQLIPHHCLEGFTENCSYQNKIYLIGTYFIFTTAMYTVVYIVGYVATRLKKAEEAYRKANILLRKKDRIKDEYVLRVTHDIKGHLAAIQSCLDVVAKKLIGPLNEQQQDFVDSADKRTKRLTYFVKALLRLTQIRLSNNLETEIFSLKDVINAALDTVGAKAREKSITLISDIDLTEDKVLGNQVSIEEVITNLLFNAIKYTAQNGEIKINAENRKDHVLVEISDTGIGIPEEELPRVFDEFYRATNAKKMEKDGRGLGLSIVKQIIERHNGKIQVSSREGVGTKFSFTLNYARGNGSEIH